MQSIGGLHSEAALAVDTKEREMVISNGTSPGVLKSLLTPNGAEPIVDKDWDWLDRP